ncbi:MAG: hypothetical protein ACYC1M_10230 [Armatimonadota bacterium]
MNHSSKRSAYLGVWILTLLQVLLTSPIVFAQGGTIETWGGTRIPPGEQSGFVSVSMGSIFAGVKRDGSIVCWGSQEKPLLYNIPEPNRDFIAVVAGKERMVGLKKNGYVIIWGRNDYNQCHVPEPNNDFVSINDGFGIKSDGTLVSFGEPSPGSPEYTDMKSVSCGETFTFGLKRDGSLVSMGNGIYSIGVLPQPNTGYIAVSTGLTHAAAVKSDGSIVCWGDNSYGKTTVPNPNTDFVAVTAGDTHTVGLKRDGTVVCWGSNTIGQCNGPKLNERFIAVEASRYGTVGVRDDGSIEYWGIPDPTFVPGKNSGFKKLALGGHRVGLRSDGSISCWGNNEYGQCDVPLPNQDFVDIAASAKHSIAVKSDGSVHIWGYNVDGRCTQPYPNRDFIAVAASSYYNIGLKRDGSIVSWNTENSEKYALPSPNTGFTAIAAGDNHFLGLRGDGSVVCWGTDSDALKAVPEPNTDYIAISAGYAHNVALRRDGSVVCWVAQSVYAPWVCAVPEPNQDFVAIAAGDDHSVGLKRDGTVVCWGFHARLSDCQIPRTKYGITVLTARGFGVAVIRNQSAVAGQIQLDNFRGQLPSQQLGVSISSPSEPGFSQNLGLRLNSDGGYSFSTYLPPPYDIKLSSPHFLAAKATVVAPGAGVNFALVNGDADGDNQINLFDLVVLDQRFGSNDPMADLDGDGHVNLFDYVVIDQSFGAKGE